MLNKKEEILKRLKNTYCRLRSSVIEGVGIFAIRDIPANKDPFEGVKDQQWHKFNMSELKKLNKEVLKMIDDFYVIEKNKTVSIPEYALNNMDISFFVNNSESPNLKTIDNGFTFITLRKVKKGEELTVAYETYDYKYERKV
ncbi:MAG: SET domain-containing protein [Patescibacteria group bacterium]